MDGLVPHTHGFAQLHELALFVLSCSGFMTGTRQASGTHAFLALQQHQQLRRTNPCFPHLEVFLQEHMVPELQRMSCSSWSRHCLSPC